MILAVSTPELAVILTGVLGGMNLKRNKLNTRTLVCFLCTFDSHCSRVTGDHCIQ